MITGRERGHFNNIITEKFNVKDDARSIAFIYSENIETVEKPEMRVNEGKRRTPSGKYYRETMVST